MLFAISTTLIYFYKKLNEKNNFCTGIDINKPEKPRVCESTGIMLLIPFWLMLLFFGLQPDTIAYGVTVTIFVLTGFFDDLKHKFSSKTLPWKTRALPVAIISLAFAGLYAPDILWIIPLSLFLAGVTSLQNTFAGLNGWEVGSGFIISLFVSYLLIGTQLFFIAISLSTIILALLVFNLFPAKVFPGDSGTFFIGSSIAALALLSKDLTLIILTFILFLPHMIDFFILKLLTNPTDATQQKTLPYRLLKNNLLTIPEYEDNKTRYDFAKLIIKVFGAQKERTIVLIIWASVIANGFFWLQVFGKI